MDCLSTHEPNINENLVINQIYYVRKQKIMLDRDLAKLYGVETKVLNQAVRRNLIRFPVDFMFELTKEEFDSLRSQFVTLKNQGAHSKYLPLAFTELGVAMLSSVLKSEKAILVNIEIIRIFTRIRRLLSDNTEMRLDIEQIKNALVKQNSKLTNHDKNIELVFSYLDELIEKKDKPVQVQKIGFRIEE